jgi:hypothetical protein
MPPVAAGILTVLSDLPEVLQLGEEAAAYVNQIVADFQGLGAGATQADVDALVNTIKTRSQKIQSMT